MGYIKLLLISMDTFLVFSGLKSSPDPMLVDRYGAKSFFKVGCRLALIWIVWVMITKLWALSALVVDLRASELALKNKVSSLLVEREYLAQSIANLRPEGVNDVEKAKKTQKTQKAADKGLKPKGNPPPITKDLKPEEVQSIDNH